MLAKSDITNFARVGTNLRPAVFGNNILRRSSVQKTPIYIEPFDSLTVWDDGDLRVTRSGDTTNYVCSALTGDTKQSIKMTGTATAAQTLCRMEAVFAAKDLRDANTKEPHIMCRFFIHESSGDTAWTYLNQIQLYIFDGSNNYYVYRIWVDSSDTAHKGWNTIWLTYKNYISSSGVVDWSDITKFRVQLVCDTGKSAIVTMDELRFFPRLDTPLVMLRFDDGLDEHYDAAVYMESKGIVGSFAIAGYVIDTADHLTTAQLHRMQKAGHLIINHSWHALDWDAVSNAEYVADILRMQEWMCRNGFSAGSRIYVSTQGKWPEGAREVMTPIADFVWLTQSVGVADQVEPLHDPWMMFQSHSYINTSAVDDAITEGAVNISMLHGLGSGEAFSWAAFETLIDYVATERDAGNIKVVTPVDIILGEYD